VVEAEAEAAAEDAGETAAELMGADGDAGDPAIEAEVTEEVFDALSEEPEEVATATAAKKK
jgi:hypothetical protein